MEETDLEQHQDQDIDNYENIYEMPLHSRIWIKDVGKDVIRVPGGWIYSDWNTETDEPYNPVFVPFDNEFQPNTKI